MRRIIFAVLLSVVMVACVLVFFGPSFLAYKEKPVKSDAVVLFLGDESKNRDMEAEKLLHEGYASYLIVPALSEVEKIMPSGKMKRVTRDFKMGDLLFKLRKKSFYHEYYEDTHIEVLEAKRLMDESGLHSASW